METTLILEQTLGSTRNLPRTAGRENISVGENRWVIEPRLAGVRDRSQGLLHRSKRQFPVVATVFEMSSTSSFPFRHAEYEIVSRYWS